MPIFGNGGATAVFSVGAVGSVDFAGVGAAGVCAFGAKRLDPPPEEPGRLAKGLGGSLAGSCCVGVSGTAGAAAACGVGEAGACWLLFDPNDWKEKLELAFGCAVNIPAFAWSLSAVFAGCGVLKPLKIFALGASGALNMGALAGFSLSLEALSPF